MSQYTGAVTNTGIPIIFANQERLRLFKIAHPVWKYLSPEILADRWKEWVENYKDGITRLKQS